MERLKIIHPRVLVRFDMDQETLTLSGRTNQVESKTFYRNCRARYDLDDAADDGQGRKRKRACQVLVDSKHLMKGLAIGQLQPANTDQPVLCCVTKHHAIVLHRIFSDNLGSVTYYVPLLSTEEEEEGEEEGDMIP